MANNLDVSEGTGKTVGTDDVSGVHIQLVKLVDGTEDSSARLGGDATNGLDVDITRVIPGTSATHLGKAVDSAAGSTDTGVAVLAVRDDAVSSLTPADGDYTHLRVDASGRLYVNLDASGVTLSNASIPTTSGGCSMNSWVSASGTTATNVKASAGQLYGYYIYNANAAMRKVAFHNTAGTPTAGSGVVMQIPLPPASGANLWMPQGVTFSTGIAFTTVQDLTTVGSTGVASGDLGITLWWK